jgi:hypothetical protein
VPELGTPGSVRGVSSNGHSYRDSGWSLTQSPRGRTLGFFAGDASPRNFAHYRRHHAASARAPSRLMPAMRGVRQNGTSKKCLP